MESLTTPVRVTPNNWQSLALASVTPERSPTKSPVVELCQKLAGDLLDTTINRPDEEAKRLGRLAVLTPMERAIYFPEGDMSKHTDSPRLRKSIAMDFGDSMRYTAALLSERSIDIPEVLGFGFQAITGESRRDVSFEDFHEAAKSQEPKCPVSLDDLPFTAYSMHISNFVSTVDPRRYSAGAGHGREAIMSAGANLIGATAYALDRYCQTDIGGVINENYQAHLEPGSGASTPSPNEVAQLVA